MVNRSFSLKGKKKKFQNTNTKLQMNPWTLRLVQIAWIFFDRLNGAFITLMIDWRGKSDSPRKNILSIVLKYYLNYVIIMIYKYLLNI